MHCCRQICHQLLMASPSALQCKSNRPLQYTSLYSPSNLLVPADFQVTAQVGAPRRIVTRSVAPIRAPTTNAAASNDLAPTHRTAELEALFADVKLHDAVDKLEETDI
jgi:hypothetical protein